MTGRSRRYDRHVAYHEAAHAVLSVHCDRRFRFVSIESHVGAAGHVQHFRGLRSASADQLTPRTIAWRVQQDVVILLAGDIAVKRWRGRRDRAGAMTDEHDVNDLASLLHERGSPEFVAFIRYMAVHAKGLVDTHWADIEAVAATLVDRRRLSERDVRRVIAQRAATVRAIWEGTTLARPPSSE